jgi:hypothetical protein
MSYQLTSLYGLAHGHAVALCLPKIWRYMIGHIELCVDERGTDYLDSIFSELDASFSCLNHNQTIEWFETFLTDLEMLPPKSGSAKELTQLVNSVNVQRLANNPVALDEDTVRFLYQQIIPVFQDQEERSVKFFRVLAGKLSRLWKAYYSRVKFDLDDTLLLFAPNQDEGYFGSQRVLYEQAHNDERFNQFFYLWAFNKAVVDNYKFLDRYGSTTVAKIGSRKYLSAIARARFLCINQPLPFWFKLRKNQIVVPADTDVETLHELISTVSPTVPSRLRRFVFKYGISFFIKLMRNEKKRITGWCRSHILAYSDNSKALRSYRNRHEGNSVILVGNGPSLTTADLDEMAGLPSFACNLIYKLFPTTRWRPSYYCCTDRIYSRTLGDELQAKVQAPFFMNEVAFRNLKRVVSEVVWVTALYRYTYKVHSDMLAYYYPARATVMSFMIELAIYMGYKNIYLLGVDCTNSFAADGHFSNDYENTHVTRAEERRARQLMNRHDANLEEIGEMRRNRSLEAYYALARYAEKKGVRIFNATRGGALEAFERIDFDEVVRQFKKGELQ